MTANLPTLLLAVVTGYLVIGLPLAVVLGKRLKGRQP